MWHFILRLQAAHLGTNWLAGRLGRYSGCTINSMCGKPVPKYAPSVWWCRDDLGVYASWHFGQYNFTIASPGTSDKPAKTVHHTVFCNVILLVPLPSTHPPRFLKKIQFITTPKCIPFKILLANLKVWDFCMVVLSFVHPWAGTSTQLAVLVHLYWLSGDWTDAVAKISCLFSLSWAVVSKFWMVWPVHSFLLAS